MLSGLGIKKGLIEGDHMAAEEAVERVDVELTRNRVQL